MYIVYIDVEIGVR